MAVVWSGGLPRPLQQVLFDAAESLSAAPGLAAPAPRPVAMPNHLLPIYAKLGVGRQADLNRLIRRRAKDARGGGLAPTSRVGK